MNISGKAYLYKHFGENGELLYIGITDDISRRFRQHARNARWFDLVRTMTYEECETYQLAAEMEVNQIRELRPAFNITHNNGRLWHVAPDPQESQVNEKVGGDIDESDSLFLAIERRALNIALSISYAVAVIVIIVAVNAFVNEHHDFMEYKYAVEHKPAE